MAAADDFALDSDHDYCFRVDDFASGDTHGRTERGGKPSLVARDTS
jgi:hypothetical protein